MANISNQTFINNITDPKTGKRVKKIYHMEMSKINRLVVPLVWEYYKNRANMSIEQVYKKFKGKGLNKLQMIFFNDPVIYEVDIE
jgi:hypothetical protein